MFTIRPKLILFPLTLLIACSGTSAFKQDNLALRRELGDLRNIQAEQEVELGSTRDEVRQLRGRLEELEFQLRRIANPNPPLAEQPQLYGQNGALPSQPSNLSGYTSPLIPRELLESDIQYAQSLSGQLRSAFMDSLLHLKSNRFAEAISLLRTSLSLSSGNETPPMILFWLAVAYEGQGDNPLAVQTYHEFVQKFPRHSRSPLVLLRQGSVLIRLKDFSTAKVVFNKLIGDFPRATESELAKERLADLH